MPWSLRCKRLCRRPPVCHGRCRPQTRESLPPASRILVRRHAPALVVSPVRCQRRGDCQHPVYGKSQVVPRRRGQRQRHGHCPRHAFWPGREMTTPPGRRRLHLPPPINCRNHFARSPKPCGRASSPSRLERFRRFGFDNCHPDFRRSLVNSLVGQRGSVVARPTAWAAG